MTRIFLHPYAGVLSAYGMGLADVRALRERQVEAPFEAAVVPALEEAFVALEAAARREILDQGVAEGKVSLQRKVHLRYEGTDSPLTSSATSPNSRPERSGV